MDIFGAEFLEEFGVLRGGGDDLDLFGKFGEEGFEGVFGKPFANLDMFHPNHFEAKFFGNFGGKDFFIEGEAKEDVLGIWVVKFFEG